jgi:hypothetical protein
MSSPVAFKLLTTAEAIVGENESETNLLREMLHSAEAYLRSFKWCPGIAERFLGFGVGGIVAVFLFRMPKKVGADDLLWVIDGDLPSAYLVTDKAPDPAAALSVYAGLMEDWARAVLDGSPLEALFPVAAPATSEHANMLLTRVQYLRDSIIPICRERLRLGDSDG